MHVDTFFIATKTLLHHDGKILVIREASKYEDGTNIGSYDFVGGRIQAGETVAEGLVRELKEEVGLDITAPQTPFAYSEFFPVVRGEQWHIVALYFIADIDDPTITLSEEHDDAKWIDMKEYKEEGLIENLYPICEKYLKKEQ